MTRWITHFCAPTFVLLAGVSAYLSGAREGSTRELSQRLLTRGLWIIFIEFTVVSFGWNLTLTGPYVAQVMWVIGASMIILAGLVHLPRWFIATFGLVMIGGHNLLDGIRAEDLGSASWIWNLLHEQAVLQISPSVKLFVGYPLVPWPGVMALGFALGPLFKRSTVADALPVWGGCRSDRRVHRASSQQCVWRPHSWAAQAILAGNDLGLR